MSLVACLNVWKPYKLWSGNLPKLPAQESVNSESYSGLFVSIVCPPPIVKTTLLSLV